MISQLDEAALAWLHQFSSPMLDRVASAVSLFGSEFVVVFGLALLVVFAWQRRWRDLVAVVLVIVGAEALTLLLKEVLQRARPESVVAFIAADQFSLPSGHATRGAAFYAYIAHLVRFRALVTAGLAVLVICIGLARMYLGVHFLSDVLAGYVVGIAWTAVVVRSLCMLSQ